MRADDVAKRDRPFLVRPIIRVPVVVHDPGVERLGRLHMLSPDVRVPLRVEQRGGDPPYFDKRRVKRDPGDAELIIADVNPAVNAEPVLTGAGDLIELRADDSERHVHAELSAGDGEREGKID